MSMTREEASKILRDMLPGPIVPSVHPGSQKQEAIRVALAALRGPTRGIVVLCKECRFWQGNNGGYPHPECRWGHDETPDEDDYCSFAEKLEVNKSCFTNREEALDSDN